MNILGLLVLQNLGFYLGDNIRLYIQLQANAILAKTRCYTMSLIYIYYRDDNKSHSEGH
ncbi:hypothetical protein RO3G_05768 [Rhizopus delemar RA 99-880]|uniref:Uncharacterized protein n=1 Tax=Rhizopus delemar (strain RA 99-880 / ATCC MYA-4621 / FGSC 9543 / NRRL 43880) TaxID=246409 RepID=I1BXY3_RHIO9|nr:hypothetical protein RO3G_05768 [Rhizopus delemar RA 99-880]|eukprot:EIE81063.1 hypothetical protein RO3G_05768 [Rhizopus delemar RA 99-880]